MIPHVLSIYELENVLPAGEIQFARCRSAIGNFGMVRYGAVEARGSDNGYVLKVSIRISGHAVQC